VDGRNLAAWRDAVRPNTKTFFLESPANPALEIVDIAAVAEIAHACGATLIVDNVFATPLWQRPLELGADCVVYSATKHIDGQGRCLGGVVLASDAFIQTHIHTYLRQTGPALSPFNAWVLLKGLETLAVRVARQTESAACVADALAGHPKFERLIYPGRADHPQAELVRRQMRAGSTLIAFSLRGGKGAAFRMMNALRLVASARRPRAPLHRPRAPRRPARRPLAGAGAGVRAATASETVGRAAAGPVRSRRP
jgi:O-succinylhomoserine sulfhydrylase